MAYIGQSPSVGEFKKLDDISGSFNNSTTTFNITSGGTSVNLGLATSLLISIDGVLQEPGSSYSISGSGSSLIFTEAPNTSSTFFGIQLGTIGQIGVPTDDTVTANKLQANSVVTVKIADSAVTTAKIADANVTTGKIADSAITSAKLGSNLILNGTTTFVGASLEKANVISSNVFSNVTIDNQNSSILFFTQNSVTNANVTVNFINMDYVPVGNVASFVVILTNNTNTQAKITGAQINSAGGNTVRFLGGVPTSGDENLDVYSFSVIKTATSGYTVLASKNNFD